MRRSPLSIRYAKLSPPWVENPVRRERLFKLLDEMRRRHPVIWIASPPGAGKTALAASYLAGASPSTVWYRMDHGDADPSSLFFFLSQAAHYSSPSCARVEKSPEQPADIRRYARRFFRDFYAQLPIGTTIVLDNIHEFDWELSGELLEIAFEEIPSGISVIAMGRDLPPARLARLQLNGLLAIVGWDELRFNRAEARALADSDNLTDAQDLSWLKQADGWAAGIIMLRDARKRHGEPSSALPSDGIDAVFRYFDGEVLTRMPVTMQRLLLMLSWLPAASATDASQLTGAPQAADLLEQLSYQRCFIDRRGTGFPVFHFHPLFRDFLQHRAQRSLSGAERAGLLERAGIILDNRGQYQEAASLYRNAGACGLLAGLLLRRAQSMLASGEGRNWLQWLSWLPPGVINAHPWLHYWQGRILNADDASPAGQALRRAEQAFLANGDVHARLLTIAAIIDNQVSWCHWPGVASLGQWAGAMIQGLQAYGPPDPDTGLRIHSCLALALIYSDPGSPQLQASVDLAIRMLPLAASVEGRLSAGVALLHCMHLIESPAASWMIAELGALANDPSITPLTRAWWHARLARYYSELAGEPGAARAMISTAIMQARECGPDRLIFQLEFEKLLILLCACDMDAARPMLTRLQSMLPPAHTVDRMRLTMAEAMILIQCGDSHRALRIAQDALSVENGISAPERARFERMAAGFHAQAGNIETADGWYAAAARHACGGELQCIEEERRLISAYGLWLKGEPQQQAIDMLRNAFSSHSQRGAHALFASHARLASSIAALALKQGIEVDHVCAIIKRRQLIAPDAFTPNWPWPIAVRTLGKLELSLDGNTVATTGKIQQRPLMMLKALLAGGEAGKPHAILADQLWSEVEFAKSAVNVTIHRLRKLLRNDAAVLVANGSVAINRHIVWSDVFALTAICREIENLRDDAPPGQVQRLAYALLDLYRGPFCDGDDSSCLMAARERCRNHFLMATSRLGERMEALNEWAGAHTLYLRALDAEPLAEIIYRGLMRCAHARNDPAAAFSAYRRCRNTLSIVLGRKPSTETEKLARKLELL